MSQEKICRNLGLLAQKTDQCAKKFITVFNVGKCSSVEGQ